MKKSIYYILFLFGLATVQNIAYSLENWPTLSVAFYDCNSTDASTADTIQLKAINSASRFIYQNIISNITNQEIFFFSYGFTDTTDTDMASSGTLFSLPDTGRFSYARYDFVITSVIVGGPGSYTLTVSILEGASYVHVADGAANFSSATNENVQTACESAVQQILPLTQKMREFHASLKVADPLLIINPRVTLSPAQLKLPLNGTTEVAITAIDCDGEPIKNRQLALEVTRGSFSLSTVQTDDNGKATVTFNAETYEGISILKATIEDAITVTHDTTSPNGSNSVLIGDIDTLNLWVLEFDMAKSFSSYKDKLSQESDGTRWIQENKFFTQHAYGSFIGTANDEDNTEFSFSDSTLSLSGAYMKHNFSKETYTDKTGNICPKVTWSMGGSSETWKAMKIEDEGGEAAFSYEPSGINLFSLAVPFQNITMYSYLWSILGRWNNGQCETEFLHQGVPSKLGYNMTGGVTFFGADPVPGLTIFPINSGGTLSGYSIYVNQTTTGYEADGTYYIVMTQCSGTLRRFSKTPTSVEKIELPKRFFLAQNYPNPFNPSTVIEFSVPQNGQATLKIYNTIGQEIATLFNGIAEAEKYHQAIFNASRFSSGVYLARLQHNGKQLMKKMVLMK